MDDALLNAVPGAVAAVVLLFLGAWENDRRTQRADARKEAAEDRAKLEAQANELVVAVMALKVAGTTHDQMWGGWRAKSSVILRALMQAGAAFAGSAERGVAMMAANQAMANVIGQWEQSSAAARAELAAPLGRLGAAITPLMRRQESGLAAAAEEVFTAVVENYADDDRISQALRAFHQALGPALEPPTTPRRWWSLRRRSRPGIPARTARDNEPVNG